MTDAEVVAQYIRRCAQHGRGLHCPALAWMQQEGEAALYALQRLQGKRVLVPNKKEQNLKVSLEA